MRVDGVKTAGNGAVPQFSDGQIVLREAEGLSVYDPVFPDDPFGP
jgi:hypothetical protein